MQAKPFDLNLRFLFRLLIPITSCLHLQSQFYLLKFTIFAPPNFRHFFMVMYMDMKMCKSPILVLLSTQQGQIKKIFLNHVCEKDMANVITKYLIRNLFKAKLLICTLLVLECFNLF